MCTAGTCGLAMCATRLMPVAKKLRIVLGAGDRCGEFVAEPAADGRDVDPDLLEHRAVHLARAPRRRRATPSLSVAVPGRVGEGGVATRPRARSPRTPRRSGCAAIRTSRAPPVAGRRAVSFGQSLGLAQRFAERDGGGGGEIERAHARARIGIRSVASRCVGDRRRARRRFPCRTAGCRRRRKRSRTGERSPLVVSSTSRPGRRSRETPRSPRGARTSTASI